jgi:hypothetical protein
MSVPPEGLHDAIEASQDGNERLEQSVLVGWNADS